jgi:hypothetical protein
MSWREEEESDEKQDYLDMNHDVFNVDISGIESCLARDTEIV